MVLRKVSVLDWLRKVDGVIAKLGEKHSVELEEHRHDTDSQWIIERGVEIGASTVLDIGNHILGGVYCVAVEEYEEILEKLKAKFGDKIADAVLDVADPWIQVAAEALVDICRFLKKTPELQFDMLHVITAIDFLHTDPKKAAKASWSPHLMLVYHLSSLTHKHRLVLKVQLHAGRTTSRTVFVPAARAVRKSSTSSSLSRPGIM